MIPSKINRKFLLSSNILTILQISLAISNVSLLLIIFILCRSIADLQCCVSFRRTAKWFSYLLFIHSIVATLCNPVDCSTSGFLVLPCLPEFIQTHVHWVNDASQQSHAVTPFSSCPQSFPASGSFPTSQLFTSGGQSIGASASIFPMDIQDWFPL